ncbi:MAG: hypothetical protein FWG87_08615 [Defluviitaleaceae bacterium]|nr:hypothetical protein [Defluviitaleaceae bacterium]
MSTDKEFFNDTRMAAEVCVFAEKYGLLGFMTALPLTAEFMEYDTVYLPKNRHIRKESMPSREYAKLFFPFEEKLNENPNPCRVYPSTEENKNSLVIPLTARRKPRAVEMCYQRTYAESLNWLMTQFKDWTLMFMASILHYKLDDALQVELYRQTIAAFDGNVPSFHIELFDKPVMVWDFNSLMSVIHLVLGLLITDEARPLRTCKYCNRAFIAKHPQGEFCKPNCKNKHNVYKSRGKIFNSKE